MTFIQLGLLLGLAALGLLAAFFPRRLARPRRSADPFVGFEAEWQEIMQAPQRPARPALTPVKADVVVPFLPLARAA